MKGRRLIAGGGLVAVLAGCGSGTNHPAAGGSSAAAGKQMIRYYGCGSCHVIGGIATANGRVGPSLLGYGAVRQIAGKLPNTAANLARWIEHPQQIVPGNDMPDLGIGPKGALDIAAYLYSQ